MINEILIHCAVNNKIHDLTIKLTRKTVLVLNLLKFYQFLSRTNVLYSAKPFPISDTAI
jgi:hypothetical protein